MAARLQADVVVVGGGLGGASTAWWLSRLGAGRVLVLEQGTGFGQEASAQNAGMLRRLAAERPERDLACRSAPFLAEPPGPEWADRPLMRTTGGVIGLAQEPCDAAAVAHARRLAEGVADLERRGVRVHHGAGAQVEAWSAALAGARPHAAWFLPDEGVLDADALVQGFLGGVRARAGSVRLGVRVSGICREGDRVVGIRTSQGQVDAGHVVLAAGAWGARLGQMLGLERPLRPLMRHLFVSRPPSALPPHGPYLWWDDVGVYARPEGAGWLASPCDESLRWPGPGPGSRGSLDPYQRAVLGDKLQQHLPALGALSFPSGWTGLRTFTPDRRPLLGPDPGLRGLWWCGGLGGFGVTCAFAAGEVVARRMLGQPLSWIDPATVDPGRFEGPAQRTPVQARAAP